MSRVDRHSVTVLHPPLTDICSVSLLSENLKRRYLGVFIVARLDMSTVDDFATPRHVLVSGHVYTLS